VKKKQTATKNPSFKIQNWLSLKRIVCSQSSVLKLKQIFCRRNRQQQRILHSESQVILCSFTGLFEEETDNNKD